MIDCSVINTTLVSPSEVLPTIQFQTEGKLEGKRVINTTEEINKIIEKCKENSVEIDISWKKSVIVAAIGVALIVTSVAAILSLPFALPALVTLMSVMAVAGVLGSGTASLGFVKILDNNIESEKNEFKIQGLSRKRFLDWAENQKIKLTFLNTGACYNRYLKLCKVQSELNFIRGL